MSADVIGESLKAYALRKLPAFSKNSLQGNDLLKYRYLVDTIICLLPVEKSSVPCGFLLNVLQESIMLECDEMVRRILMQKIAQQLDEVTVADLMIRSLAGETALCDIDIVHELVEQFTMQESTQTDCPDDHEFRNMYPGFLSDASKTKVARLVDGYLAEAAKDASLILSKFVNLAEMVSSFPRSSHDGIYHAIDMYLKEHPRLTKSEKKRICRFMDCKKLSADACAHAVQNERLPLWVVVQVLFFEQARAAGNSTPDVPGSVRAMLPRGSCGSSRSATTNSDEDWDGDQTSEELKDSKGERNKGGSDSNSGILVVNDAKSNAEKVNSKKVKKMFVKLWSTKDRQGENSSWDTSRVAQTSRK